MISIKLNYPSQGEFKLSDVMVLNEGMLIKNKPLTKAKAAIQLRCDLEDGIITRVGKAEKTGNVGKPSYLYIKNKTPNKVPLPKHYNNISVPSGNFTIKQLTASNENLKNSVANQFIRIMTKRKMIVPVSKQKSLGGRGKPATVYCSKSSNNVSM